MEKFLDIEGEGIKLLALTEQYIESVRKWRNQDHIRKWFICGEIISAESQLQWYKKYLDKPDDLMFVIESSIPGTGLMTVGTVALYNIDLSGKTAEFGRLMIGETAAAGRGIALKATSLICKYGFNNLGLESIYLSLFLDNERAANIYRRIGFINADPDTSRGSRIVGMVLSQGSFKLFQKNG